VVEDNADSREMLFELLQMSGFHCQTAANGSEALELMRQQRPDIAILDVGLPGMDGFELARHIRQDPHLGEICLVALTGYGQPADRANSRQAGFDAHLTKPVQPDELVAMLYRMREQPPAGRGRPSAPASGPPNPIAQPDHR
jgi:CheY-like chemotaxis protein